MMEPAKEKDAVIKVNETIRDMINAIGAELGGKTQKEVAEYLLALYQKEKAERTGEAIPHLDVLREFFARVEGIYTEAVLTARDRERFSREKIAALEEELRRTKAELLDKQKELEAAGGAIRERDRLAEERVEAAKAEAALAREEAQRELAAMRELLDEARKSEEKSQRLALLMQESVDQAKRKADEFAEKAARADELARELAKTKKELEELRAEFDRFKAQAEFERERAVLEAEKRAMKELREALDEVGRLRALLAKGESGKPVD